MSDFKMYPDAASLARAAAEHFATLAERSLGRRGCFAVALAGGSTPRSTYALLACDRFASRLDWSRIHAFWSDERCVPPDHPDSNHRMAREALLDRVPIPRTNVHRIEGELPPHRAAGAYQAELERVLGPGGRFDLVLLGMGEDGHTASLFPGSAAIHEWARWVVAVYVEKLSMWRITLTPAAINAAAHVTFIVAGASKAERLRDVLMGSYRPLVLPAQIVRPAGGRSLWLLDAAAASDLGRERL